jgi:hypothetical protein
VKAPPKKKRKRVLPAITPRISRKKENAAPDIVRFARLYCGIQHHCHWWDGHGCCDN